LIKAANITLSFILCVTFIGGNANNRRALLEGGEESHEDPVVILPFLVDGDAGAGSELVGDERLRGLTRWP
jgi:hypothetical protein